MHWRDFFKEQVSWQLGNGAKVNAIFQPWFRSWKVQDHATVTDRRMKVSSLWDENAGQWKVNELHRLFQPNQVQDIMSGQKLEINSVVSDRMVWHESKNGKYSVKEGYNKITQLHMPQAAIPVVNWTMVWKWKRIPPKIKLFIWRLFNKGLPLAVHMHERLSHFSPMCQRCGEENEFEMHCLFFCNTSRQVWFGCSLGIRVHELPMDFLTTFEQITAQLDEEGIIMFCTTIWEIWKERNKAVIEHAIFHPQSVLMRVNAALRPELAHTHIDTAKIGAISGQQYQFYQEGWQVLVDASWVTSGNSGGAFVVYEGGEMRAIGMHNFIAHDAFMAEAVALQAAMQYVYGDMNKELGTKLQFFSDCLTLVQAVNQGDTADLPSWRATTVVNQIINQMEVCQQGASMHHARREAIHIAHDLANRARRSSINYQGEPTMWLHQLGEQGGRLDVSFFQSVQERPP
ncbi:reverse transcriptase [Rhynchospora pubera]|uniref:Reverse transcriptase n=1 Tax=Rhynchospora pubera TaxID=906938 RepID=A0AAV8ESB4_9POAL|nr:reverse transcriptase [Rhynchospora pubera]